VQRAQWSPGNTRKSRKISGCYQWWNFWSPIVHIWPWENFPQLMNYQDFWSISS
jgi:hypothetical protein